MHGWHERNGALFEDVGQWRRAWYYPQHGEDLHAAVNREVKAVRDSLGILDATTLGKIDIQGPDEIGRASCRERGCQYGEISVSDVPLHKKVTHTMNKPTLHRNKRRK